MRNTSIVATLWLGLLIVVASVKASATSIAIPIRNVTPENGHNYGIEVRILDYEAKCQGGQFWISAPREATKAHLRYLHYAAHPELAAIDIEPQIVELEADPELDPTAPNTMEPGGFGEQWLEERRKHHGFLAGGFRGVSFCLKHDFIARTTFAFHSDHAIWDLGNLGQWYKEP